MTPRTTTLALLSLLIACDPPKPASLAPNASPEIVEALREDLATSRHPSDGGGRASLVDGPAELPAGGQGRWTFEYETGPTGIAEGGWIFFQAPPFWNWSTPQTTAPSAPGYTEVSTAAHGVSLEATTVDRQLLGIRIGGRPLEEGEIVRLVYGSGPAGAQADPFAERQSPFWFAVDGDGDGIRQLVPQPPTVEVVGGSPASLILTLPSVARPGAAARLRVAVVDAAGNLAGAPLEESVALVWLRLDRETEEMPIGLPQTADLASPVGTSIAFQAPATGTWLVRATAGDVSGRSNPMAVTTELPTVLWGDLHGHSNLSDGTGTPAQYFAYARDVAGLDFVALTDHDHWGLQPLSRNPEMWEEIRGQVAAFNDPGRFTTLLGYEWTNWLHGHRHVLYFGDSGPVLSSIDPRYETPAQLWAALRGMDAMTFAHHSAGEPVATNWDYPPDPVLEPITEVVSVHGSSEANGGPPTVRGAIAGNYVRDALDRGYRLGFIGSGDGHDGHPGLAQLANPSGGLAAVLTEDRTRDGIATALRSRLTYATNGPRILLHATLDGAPMGSNVTAASRSVLEVAIAGTEPLERVDVIQSGRPVASLDLRRRFVAGVQHPIEATRSGDYVYLRVIQTDGGAAWSSPFFVD